MLLRAMANTLTQLDKKISDGLHRTFEKLWEENKKNNSYFVFWRDAQPVDVSPYAIRAQRAESSK